MRKHLSARKRGLFLTAVCCIGIFLLLLVPAAAEADISGQIADESGLDDIYGSVDDSLSDALRQMTDTKTNGVSAMLSYLADSAKTYAPALIHTALSILALLILSAAMRLFAEPLSPGGVSRLYTLLTGMVAALLIFQPIRAALEQTMTCLTALGGISESVTIVLCTLSAFGGQTISAVNGQIGMSVLLNIFDLIGRVLLPPAVQFSVVLAIAGLFSRRFALAGIGRAVRSIFIWSMGFLTTALTAVLAFQKILSASADCLGVRGVKFALGNLVPVIGASLGDAVLTVATALKAVRGMAGAVGIAAILLTAAAPLISLLLLRLLFAATSATAEMLGLTAEGGFLKAAGETVGFMTAVLTMSSVLFILQCGILLLSYS